MNTNRHPEPPNFEAPPAFIWVVLAVAVVFFSWIGYSRYTGGGSPAQQSQQSAPYEPSESEALVTCRNAVRDRLKSPKSAEFKGVFESPLADVQRLNSGKYRVASWVDAQNSFGATIRSTFECVVDLRSNRLVSLTIE